MKLLKRLLCGLAAVVAVLSFQSCTGTDEPQNPSITDKYVGKHNGTITLTIGGQYTYNADIAVSVAAGENETLSVTIPEYSFAGTMMGDLTMGAVTISDLKYDEAKGGFYRSYGGEGMTQHFKAMQNGVATMDSDYPLNDPSSILVTIGEDGKIKIENPFKLGKMPLSLTSTFEGRK